MNRYARREAGFGLLEVLVAAVVVSVGLMASMALQAKLVTQSRDSKARTEATALAEARIEELRNYTAELATIDDFEAEFAATAGFVNDVPLNGVTAAYTRSEAIGDANGVKRVRVRVAWQDTSGVDRRVLLETALAWESPRSPADLARLPAPAPLNGPTSIAYVGDEQLSPSAQTVANGDGTELYVDGSGNPQLVVDGRIVLTLTDACQVTGCDAFATIGGTIYIDKATQTIAPGEVQVYATGASYCHRFYVNASGQVVSLTMATSSALLSAPDQDYEYFSYRCYVGSGWYGNIGVLLPQGLTLSDKVCQGDPLSVHASSRPVNAARRSYRGVLYKQTAAGLELDADGDPVPYTAGIDDGAVLPDGRYPEWEAGAPYMAGDGVVFDRYVYLAKAAHSDASTPPPEDGLHWWLLEGHQGHDFVIGSVADSVFEGNECIESGIMTRPDSVEDGILGSLFRGMPAAAVCLNPDHVEVPSGSFEVPLACL